MAESVSDIGDWAFGDDHGAYCAPHGLSFLPSEARSERTFPNSDLEFHFEFDGNHA